MGITVGVLAVKTHCFQQFSNAVCPLLLIAIEAMNIETFGNNFPGGHPRVEGSIRILEDHLHVASEGLTLSLRLKV